MTNTAAKLASVSLFVILAITAYGPRPAVADAVHMHYFESADVLLGEQAFQLLTFSAQTDELVTIVAYGLDEGLLPAITLLDRDGITLAEDINPDELSAAMVQARIPQGGVYSFLVTRREPMPGLLRVMLFEGDPLAGNVSLLDTVDPISPGRAYLVAGNHRMKLAVTAPTDLLPIYAARGSNRDIPPLLERSEPILESIWQNDDSAPLYTLSVRAIPDLAPGDVGSSAGRAEQRIIRLDLNNGSAQPEFVPRDRCVASVIANADLHVGPSESFRVVGSKNAADPLEIIGAYADYFLVPNAADPSGESWILQGEVALPTSMQCAALPAIQPPELTEEVVTTDMQSIQDSLTAQHAPVTVPNTSALPTAPETNIGGNTVDPNQAPPATNVLDETVSGVLNETVPGVLNETVPGVLNETVPGVLNETTEGLGETVTEVLETLGGNDDGGGLLGLGN